MTFIKQELLERPMSRAEFLKQIGVGFVLLLGGSVLLQLLQGVPKTLLDSANNPYGIRTYGGSKQTS